MGSDALLVTRREQSRARRPAPGSRRSRRRGCPGVSTARSRARALVPLCAVARSSHPGGRRSGPHQSARRILARLRRPRARARRHLGRQLVLSEKQHDPGLGVGRPCEGRDRAPPSSWGPSPALVLSSKSLPSTCPGLLPSFYGRDGVPILPHHEGPCLSWKPSPIQADLRPCSVHRHGIPARLPGLDAGTLTQSICPLEEGKVAYFEAGDWKGGIRTLLVLTDQGYQPCQDLHSTHPSTL